MRIRKILIQSQSLIESVFPKAHLDFSYFPTLFRKQLRNAFCPSPASHHRQLALSDILLFLIAVYGNIVANRDGKVKGRDAGSGLAHGACCPLIVDESFAL